METLTVTGYPKNANHVRKLVTLCREILIVCDELNIQPVLSGCMAAFAYTNDPELEVADLDLSCSEKEFPALKSAIESRSVLVNVTSWHVLQVRDEELKIEFDSQEVWMADMDLAPLNVDLYGLRLRIVDHASLLELYRRAIKTLSETKDPLQRLKCRKLKITYSTIEAATPSR